MAIIITIIIIIITMYYSIFRKYRRADTRMGMSVRPFFRQDVSRHVRTLDGYCYWEPNWNSNISFSYSR